jgi:hypothetical protein
MRRQLNQKINRLEEKLSAVAGISEVMFVMPDDDIDEAKQQRYGDDFPDDAHLLVVTFAASQNT